jgi:hypothetical protein
MPHLPVEDNRQSSGNTTTAAFLQWREDNKYTFHFIALLAFLVVIPLLQDNNVARFVTDILLVLLLFFAILAIGYTMYIMVAGIVLAGITILLFALFYLTGIAHYFNAALVVSLVFFIMVSVTIFTAVIREREMRRDTIIGAISVYFLLGLTWAIGIIVMMIFSPGSFDIATGSPDRLVYLSDYIAYSFSILTTTGNYNIIALTSTARTVTMFETITGTLYIAILVSWLVGKFLQNKE